MTADRPEYVKCISHTRVDLEGETLCRKSSRMTWCFGNIHHAFNTAVQGSRLLICPECAEVAIIALQKGTFGAVDAILDAVMTRESLLPKVVPMRPADSVPVCYHCDKPNNTGRPCRCTTPATNE